MKVVMLICYFERFVSEFGHFCIYFQIYLLLVEIFGAIQDSRCPSQILIADIFGVIQTFLVRCRSFHRVLEILEAFQQFWCLKEILVHFENCFKNSQYMPGIFICFQNFRCVLEILGAFKKILRLVLFFSILNFWNNLKCSFQLHLLKIVLKIKTQ